MAVGVSAYKCLGSDSRVGAHSCVLPPPLWERLRNNLGLGFELAWVISRLSDFLTV